MDKTTLLNSIKKLREISPKRNFTQSIDIILNLKNINLKKPEQKVDIFVTLPHSKGKPSKVCGLVGNELASQSKATFDKTILNEEFSSYNEKKILKKLATEFDFFVAQANLMAQIATTFGRTLGPRGKMPNPKAGCVVPGTAQLAPLKEKLQKTVHLETKTEPTLKTSIGIESMKDEDLAENAYQVYNSIVHLLPQENQSIKSIIIKMTMSNPVIVTEKGPVVRVEEKGIKQKETSKK